MSLDKPTLLAFLLCDSIIVEEGSKKKTLVGVFTTIRTKALPCIHPSMALYFSLTNARGDYDFLIRLNHMETGNLIGELKIKASVENILAISDFGFSMPPLKLTHAGRYEFVFQSNGELLGRQEFVLQKSGGVS